MEKKTANPFYQNPAQLNLKKEPQLEFIISDQILFSEIEIGQQPTELMYSCGEIIKIESEGSDSHQNEDDTSEVVTPEVSIGIGNDSTTSLTNNYDYDQTDSDFIVNSRENNSNIITSDLPGINFESPGSAPTRHPQVNEGSTYQKLFLCGTCGLNYKNYSQLKNHCRIHESQEEDDNIQSSTKNKPFKCQYCKKAFGQKVYLKRHERGHTGNKPFKCQHCEKTFNKTCDVRRHELTHTGEKPFKCQFCVKAFTQEVSCRRHERTHAKDKPKPFECQYCEKTFGEKATLKCHELLHTGEKPFTCQYCEETFNKKVNLQRHERVTHTGETPFQCKYCEKAFQDKYRLNCHEYIHVTGRKPFKCQYCDKFFAQSQFLRRHQRNYHPQEEYSKTNNIDLI